jgi:hypothetical protein
VTGVICDRILCYMYKAGFGLVNIFAYDNISDDFFHNYYLYSGSSHFCRNKKYIMPAKSDARYLRESLGLNQEKNAKTTIKACVTVLNIFTWAFILSMFINTFNKLYSESIEHSFIFCIIILQIIFFCTYFYTIHKSMECYWRGKSNYIDIRLYMPLNIFIILFIPAILSFPQGLCVLCSILLLSIILSLPVFPLYLVIAGKVKRQIYREVV